MIAPMSHDLSGIGVRLKQARERAGLTQVELAAKLDISVRQYQHYEAGTTKPFAKIGEIAEATNVSVAWLLGGEDIDARLAALEEKALEVVELGERLEEMRHKVEQLLRLQQVRDDNPGTNPSDFRTKEKKKVVKRVGAHVG